MTLQPLKAGYTRKNDLILTFLSLKSAWLIAPFSTAGHRGRFEKVNKHVKKQKIHLTFPVCHRKLKKTIPTSLVSFRSQIVFITVYILARDTQNPGWCFWTAIR